MGFDTQSEKHHEENVSQRVCSLEMVANMANGKSQK